MSKQRRIQLFALTILLVVVLSACSSGTSMYEMPIGAEGGWGWLQWIIKQVANFTYWVSVNIGGGSYWIGLVIVTLIVRAAGWPIYARSNAMTMNMQQAQPELNKIQEKYKGKTDEVSQKKQQQETLEVYKKYNVNPLGCLLPFLQMPIFIAMYQVVRRMPLSLGVDGTMDYSDLSYTFLGMDLKAGIVWSEGLGIFPEILLPIAVGVLMFAYQRYSTKKPEYLQNKKYESAQASQTANQMKYMSYFMVFMLVSIAVTNNGIALYWVIGNSFQFFQTYMNRRSQYKKYLERQKEQRVIL